MKNKIQFARGLRDCWIAGGAVLSHVTKTEIADLDVYPMSKEGLFNAIDYFLEDGFCLFISEKAITIKTNDSKTDDGLRQIVQIMTYDVFPEAEDIFENFDFTVCMGAYNCNTQELVTSDDFWADIASKTLRFNNKTRYPINSILRTIKYRAKGFYISKPEFLKMALTAIEVGAPKSWEELEEQIGGTYGRIISLNAEDDDYSFSRAIELLSDIDDISSYEIDPDLNEYASLKLQHLSIIYGNVTKWIEHNQRLYAFNGTRYVNMENFVDILKRLKVKYEIDTTYTKVPVYYYAEEEIVHDSCDQTKINVLLNEPIGDSRKYFKAHLDIWHIPSLASFSLYVTKNKLIV